MGGSEILLILLAVLVLFGADKLPEFARTIGKGMREVKKATDELKEEITRETSEIKNQITESTDNLKFTELDDLRKDINENLDNIKASGDDIKKEIDKP